MITSFLVIFFFWVIFFFLPKATKKNTHPIKKNNHQQTKLLIQRKHLYAYDMTFLCPHPSFFSKLSLRNNFTSTGYYVFMPPSPDLPLSCPLKISEGTRNIKDPLIRKKMYPHNYSIFVTVHA